jgi:hypothetical protein
LGAFKKMKALVIGNGESRSWFNPSKDNEFVTWGCNAIYRDGEVDNLVAVDYAMQQEIVESQYPLKNKCWFTNWSTVPDFVADTMFMGYDIPKSFIHYSGNKTDKCVISGKDPATLQEKIDTVMHMNPDLDIKDLRMKMEKDSGVWITYVTGNERIRSVVGYLHGWSAGNTALHLACNPPKLVPDDKLPAKPDEVYMIGFDLSSYDHPLNNMYKGTDNYLPANAKGFNSVNWMNQLEDIFSQFSDTTFYWVDRPIVPEMGLRRNVIYINKDELCEELKIT